MAEYVRDTFTRTVGAGWGTSEVGGAWTEVKTGTNTSIAGAQARAQLLANVANQADERLDSATAARDVHAATLISTAASWVVDHTVTVWLRAAGAVASPVGVYARAAFKADGSINLIVGYAVTAGTPVDLASTTFAAGSWSGATHWRLEVAAQGSPTKLRARLYQPSVGTPSGSAGWLTAGDDTGSQVAGAYAVRVIRANHTANSIVDLQDFHASDIPQPDFTYTASGLTATFATTGTTGDFTAYSWDWGDGTTAGTGSTPSHTYGSGGTYLVTLTGTTRWGSTFFGLGYVAVAAPPPEPPELLPSVKIAGVEVCDSVYSVTWNLGRSSWFQPIAGQTASIRLRGTYTCKPGDPVTISVPNAVSGVSLWVGTVDEVSEVKDPVDERDETLVTAMDLASRLARRHPPRGTSLGTTKLPDRLEDLRPSSSVKFRYRYSAAVAGGRWMDLRHQWKPDRPWDRSYLDLIGEALNASFAFGYSSGDGVISYAPIEAPASLPSTPRIDLNTGIDCASRVTLNRNNLDGMVNKWNVGPSNDPPDPDNEFQIANVPSIETFGERAYSVPSNVVTQPQNWTGSFARFWDGGSQGLYVSLADPVRGAEVEVPVTDWAQKVITVSPLSFATWNAKVYSIVGIRHEVTVGDAWRCTLNLDRNPWEMDGRAVP